MPGGFGFAPLHLSFFCPNDRSKHTVSRYGPTVQYVQTQNPSVHETQATGKPPHGGAHGCLHKSSPAAAGLLGS